MNKNTSASIFWQFILLCVGIVLAAAVSGLGKEPSTASVLWLLASIAWMMWVGIDLIWRDPSRPHGAVRGLSVVALGVTLQLLIGCGPDTSPTRVTVTAHLVDYNAECDSGDQDVTLGLSLAPPDIEGTEQYACEFDGEVMTCERRVTDDLSVDFTADLGLGEVRLSFDHCWWRYEVTGEVWE